MNGHKRTRYWTAGFTYVEMLVVLALIGILAGAVVVSLQGRSQTFALKTATKNLSAALRFAREEARLRQRPHRLVFSEDLNAYRVESAESVDTLEFTAVKGRAGAMWQMPRGVRVTGVSKDGQSIELASVAVGFGPDGSGFSGLIELVNDQGEMMRIEVIGETGQIHVRDDAGAEAVE
jgi:type II secretion system protein H